MCITQQKRILANLSPKKLAWKCMEWLTHMEGTAERQVSERAAKGSVAALVMQVVRLNLMVS